jgi:hypothetical protein
MLGLRQQCSLAAKRKVGEKELELCRAYNKGTYVLRPYGWGQKKIACSRNMTGRKFCEGRWPEREYRNEV